MPVAPLGVGDEAEAGITWEGELTRCPPPLPPPPPPIDIPLCRIMTGDMLCPAGEGGVGNMVGDPLDTSGPWGPKTGDT